jgi:hypothetical protein
MPIRCTISHLDRMVVGVSEGVVTLKDIAGFLDAVVEAGAQPYPKLFDAMDGVSGLSEADLKILSARLFAPPGPARPLGPFAVVARSDRSELALVLRPFSLIKRPMRVFRDIHSARKWLSYQPVII